MNRMLQRRELLSLGGSALGSVILSTSAGAEDKDGVRASYLKSIQPTRQDIDDWLGGRKYPFAKCVPELGARKMQAYADRPCRINSYGDSFTSCEQVSDGETWQEVLARHLCEPVRNYGIGGYSVYQSYLRQFFVGHYNSLGNHFCGFAGEDAGPQSRQSSAGTFGPGWFHQVTATDHSSWPRAQHDTTCGQQSRQLPARSTRESHRGVRPGTVVVR